MAVSTASLLTARPAYRATPVVYRGAFLESVLHNPFPEPLLEGAARVFLGHEYLGEAAWAASLELLYRIPGPSWRLRYDLRYDTSRKVLAVEAYGMVLQESGEDWTEVDLVLSTRLPSSGLRAPQPRPLLLEGRARRPSGTKWA